MIKPSKWSSGVPPKLKSKEFNLVVDFGCGANPRNPFKARKLIGLDVFEEPPYATSIEIEYTKVSPDGKLPFPDSSVDALTAFDVLEHIPRQSGYSSVNPFIDIMNEIYRVLKPGGLLLAVTPCFPSGAAFQDPTHVNVITPETHKYFSEDVWGRSLGYGFRGVFVSVSVGWYDWPGSFIDLAKVDNHTKVEEKVESYFEGKPPKRGILTRLGLFSVSLLKEGIFSLSTLINKASFGWIRKPSHFMWALRKPE